MASKIAMETASSIYWSGAGGAEESSKAIEEIAEIIDAAINEAIEAAKREPEGSLQP